MVLSPWMGSTFPLATMFSAVAFTVWYGGWGPALVTALGGWFADNIVFRSGQGFITQGLTFNEAVGLAVYLRSRCWPRSSRLQTTRSSATRWTA